MDHPDLMAILTRIDGRCARMERHICFVERTYDNVRAPFEYVMNKARRMLSIEPAPSETWNIVLDNGDSSVDLPYSVME